MGSFDKLRDSVLDKLPDGYNLSPSERSIIEAYAEVLDDMELRLTKAIEKAEKKSNTAIRMSFVAKSKK